MKNPIGKCARAKKNPASKELGDELGPYSLRHRKEEKAETQDVGAVKIVGLITQALTWIFL